MSPVYDSLMTDEAFAARLSEIVERLQPMAPTRILLFGSGARGDRDHLSDIDVIVVAEKVPTRFLDRLEQAIELIGPRYALDVLVYTPAEYRAMRERGNPLIEAAEREGRVLFERPAA